MEHQYDVEKRLNDLEMKVGLSEDLLDQLNLTIYKQQQQIDDLVLQLTRLRQQIPDAGGGEAAPLRDELPPHY